VNPPGRPAVRTTRMFGRPVLTVITRIAGHPAAIDTRLLSDEERECLRGIAGPVQQREYAAGRTLIHRVVGRVAGIPPRRVRIALDGGGRPYVDWRRTRGCPPGLDVNVSHSGGLVAVALGSGVRVGIDLERRVPRAAADDLARRFFSSAEYDRLRRRHPDHYLRHWYRIWTTREAHAKARGVGIWGISTPLEHHGRDWQRSEPPAPAHYTASVVALSPERTGRIRSPHPVKGNA
jgi:4'-phosphopantetheinyl transferase